MSEPGWKRIDRGCRSSSSLEILIYRSGRAIAHYVYPGGGGVVIAEQDDPKVIYESAVAYAAWLDFDIKPALTVDDAVPIILASLS